MNHGTRTLAVVVLSFALRHSMHGQTTTTTTNCNVYGNTANCTSTSTDDSAQKAQQAQQQRQAYESGQKVGAALAFNRNLRKYCAAHPREDWHRTTADQFPKEGHCPSDDDKAAAVANEFMAHHKDFIHNPTNAQTLVTYLETNNLDPRERKSYEKAYKNLKKAGKLELYAK
jgi:hypothetical protein